MSIHVGDIELHVGVNPADLLGRLEDIFGGMVWQLPLAGASFEARDVVITGSVVTPLELTRRRGGPRVARHRPCRLDHHRRDAVATPGLKAPTGYSRRRKG